MKQLIYLITTFCLSANALPLGSGTASIEKLSSSQEEVLACAAELYLGLNAQGQIDAEYALRRAESVDSIVGTFEVSRNDASRSPQNISETVAEAKLSKTLIDLSLSKQVNSLQKERESSQQETKNGLLSYLKTINTLIFDYLTLQQDREFYLSQVAELKKLRDYTERLSGMKVVDRADFLLLEDSFKRTEVSLANITLQGEKVLRSLQTGIGLKVSEIQATANNEVSFEELQQQIVKHPKVRASQLKIESLKAELSSAERDWWPTLSAEVGVNQQLAQSNLTTDPSARPFAAIALTMNLNHDLHSANRASALQSLRQYENRLENSLLEEKQTLEQQQSELESLKAQKSLTQQRVDTLNSLYQLQLTKFKAGRLSFFQLKDIEVDLFDAKRLAAKLDRQILRVKSENWIYSNMISKNETNFLKSKCKR